MQVILHTYIDSLRSEERREVNHHGAPRIVGGNVEVREINLFWYNLFYLKGLATHLKIIMILNEHIVIMIANAKCNMNIYLKYFSNIGQPKNAWKNALKLGQLSSMLELL